ncbi:hypothetical protein A8924_0068 [Saccharopolyspora erythraea NRRL 2338]|uniref:Uncharacterized protein n=2 Tax=Saccharopolyspora erythraea TaxID=1836 RepID=A4FQC0_SACEN|nr:hypothetical protein [Saccharopolyspora erythraea]EQD86279.1 hypothetical protein N599_10160 [Saccharopolyspora erythraea D]PFG92845.1 hypothetical protein A8924_0068 [Saccharopolyspora erythraea NRRL 2338]QRK89758.1 hypothetical protein JQX30_35500 [Saccharopolyspora erythraea]CAM06245.1 hypothetical protein SACE_7085 [Saccharopolyspora erythraea NRRL 2338]
MPVLVDVLVHAPLPIAAVVLLLRYGPSALLVTIAGVVAVLAVGERGDRALTVLRLLRATGQARGRTRRS